MSSLVISGDTSGTVTLDAPSVAGANTITFAAQTGTLNVAAPAFSASRGSDQTVTLGVETKILFANEQFDTNNCYDSTTNYRFTPNVAGYYQVNWAVCGRVATTFTSIYSVLFKNGSFFQYSGELNATITANTNATVTGSAVVYMNGTTDYLEVYGYLGGSGTANFRSQCHFSASLARGA